MVRLSGTLGHLYCGLSLPLGDKSKSPEGQLFLIYFCSAHQTQSKAERASCAVGKLGHCGLARRIWAFFSRDLGGRILFSFYAIL